MFKTVLDVVEKNLCTGCGTCYSFCPMESIEICVDPKKGIYVPKIQEKCNECGICLKVCPGHEFDFKKYNKEVFGKLPDNELIGNFSNCYLGYSNDPEIRYNSSSGGVVTQILVSALEEGLIDGALVTRMKKDDPFVPEPFIATTKEEIIESSKSIYCPTSPNTLLKTILKSKYKKIAFVGLPCHIHGIRKAENINKELKEKIIIHIGIFCSSVPNFLATNYLVHKYRVDKEDVEHINYRGNGWPGSLNILLVENEVSIPLHEYRNSGFAEYFIPIRCKLCIDLCNEFADISVADAWIPEIMKHDKKGTSLFVIRNNEAKNFINNVNIDHKIHIHSVEPEKIVQSQKYLIPKKSYYKNFSLLNSMFKPYYNVKNIKPPFRSYIHLLSYSFGKLFASEKHLWNIIIYYKGIKQKMFGGYVTRFFKKMKLK